MTEISDYIRSLENRITTVEYKNKVLIKILTEYITRQNNKHEGISLFDADQFIKDLREIKELQLYRRD